jgi:predicted transglutaminase-like protease
MEDAKFAFTDGCFLKEDSIKSPEAVIKEFYTLWDIEYVKIMIWKMFKGAIDSESQVLISEDQVLIMDEQFVDIIFFIETFIMFNMAVHELYQRIKQQ